MPIRAVAKHTAVVISLARKQTIRTRILSDTEDGSADGLPHMKNGLACRANKRVRIGVTLTSR